MTEPIPGPKTYPFVGNLFDLRHDEGSLKAVTQLADIYGDVFRIKVAGKRQIMVCSAELLMQFADESQFEKLPPPAITRSSGPQGLFTARSDDPDWAQAHRILTPAFGILPVADMTAGTSKKCTDSVGRLLTNGRNERYCVPDGVEMGETRRRKSHTTDR